ncbi:hypothetical protein ABFV99_14005 [Cytobacillus horneckiae]|uniref:hypothetical protein n=1 Tax=Cytobacillus horneckiae TaxID=549687 RepID=UPI0034CE52DA
MDKTNGYDIEKIYNYDEYPDVHSGRCDNCGGSHFESKVGDGKFLRECRKCGMKKLI